MWWKQKEEISCVLFQTDNPVREAFASLPVIGKKITDARMKAQIGEIERCT